MAVEYNFHVRIPVCSHIWDSKGIHGPSLFAQTDLIAYTVFIITFCLASLFPAQCKHVITV